MAQSTVRLCELSQGRLSRLNSCAMGVGCGLDENGKFSQSTLHSVNLGQVPHIWCTSGHDECAARRGVFFSSEKVCRVGGSTVDHVSGAIRHSLRCWSRGATILNVMEMHEAEIHTVRYLSN